MGLFIFVSSSVQKLEPKNTIHPDRQLYHCTSAAVHPDS
jgi:hypothetical protein